MERVGIRALKQNASAVLARVVAGEVLLITDRGRPVAQLSPLAADPRRRYLDAGVLREAAAPSRAFPDPVAGDALSSEVLRMREQERY